MAVFKAPDSVAKNAQQALDWREKYPKETARAGTQVGWIRARQLANQENISEDTINRMVSFFARHEKNKEIADEYKDEPWKDNGYLMWLAWGGDEGWTWAERIKEEINNQYKKSYNMGNMNKMQYTSVKFEAKSFDEIEGIVTGYACYYENIDRVGHIIHRGACDEQIQMFNNAKQTNNWGFNKIPVLKEHNTFQIYAINIEDLYNDDKGLICVFKISDDFRNLEPEKYKQLIQDIIDGKMFFSIGFAGLRSDYDPIMGIKHFRKIKIKEISLTTNPMNKQATILELKSINTPTFPMDIESSWDGTLAEKRWREYTNSTEKPTAEYKNGFLYYDRQNEDNFGAYHLNVVDIVNGEPVVNEKAMITAYAAMKGARNGLTVVPENEMKKLEASVNELYKRANNAREKAKINPLPMPNFYTKSAFDIALENANNKIGLHKLLSNEKKNGSIDWSHSKIKKFAKSVFPQQKMLDNQNNEVLTLKSEHPVVDAPALTGIAEDTKPKTNLENVITNIFKTK